MRASKLTVLLLALAALTCGCQKGLDIGGKGGQTPKKPDPVEVTEPASCSNKIVAHRGGSSECGAPDNSLASLRYAMGLGLYGSECDIYWTKDGKVVVGHATSDYKINNLVVWEHTLDEIRKAGKLKNGEEIPCLEDFLKAVMVEGNCTKLVLDIKNTSPTAYAIKAVQQACVIIQNMNAKKFCEFICTGNTTVAAEAAKCMRDYGIPVGWMANKAPADHKAAGFTWANLSAKSYMTPYGNKLTIKQFVDAGMEISVFNVDKAGSTDGNAVTSDSDVQYYLDNYKDLRAICTNYPKWLKSQL